MGNKRWDYYLSYIDPIEIASKTPAKRLYSVAGPYPATGVSRAVTQFWKEMLADNGWGKKDVVLIGCMPAGLTRDMKKEETVDEEEIEAAADLEEDEDGLEAEDEEDEDLEDEEEELDDEEDED